MQSSLYQKNLRLSVQNIINQSPTERALPPFEPKRVSYVPHQSHSKKIVLTNNFYLDLQIKTKEANPKNHHSVSLKNRIFTKEKSTCILDNLPSLQIKNLGYQAYQSPITELITLVHQNENKKQKQTVVNVETTQTKQQRSVSKISSQQTRPTLTNSLMNRSKSRRQSISQRQEAVSEVVKQFEHNDEKEKILDFIDSQTQDCQLDSKQLNQLCEHIEGQSQNFNQKYIEFSNIRKRKIPSKPSINNQYEQKKEILRMYDDDIKRCIQSQNNILQEQEYEQSPQQIRMKGKEQQEILKNEQVDGFQRFRRYQQKTYEKKKEQKSLVSQLSQEKLGIISQQLDPILKEWVKQNKIELKQEEVKGKQEWGGFKLVFQQETQLNNDHIQRNIVNLLSNSYKIKQIQKENPSLVVQNIPKIIYQKNLTRYEVHHLYTLYKSLQMITSKRNKNYDVKQGLDFESFRCGVPSLYLQSLDLGRAIFNIIDSNFAGFLNWEEFIELMSRIKTKNISDKVDLFMVLADQNGNGKLSWQKTINLCKMSLKSLIHNQDDHLNKISEFFTGLIFSILGVEINGQIELIQLKQAILEEREGSEFLCLFAGAD